jgi:hypothetical protein
MTKCKCGVTASFGLPNEKAIYCVSHKENNMINVVDVLCKECDKRAMYNERGNTGGIYCRIHKKKGMVNVKAKRCSFIYENGLPCYTVPIYNKNGELKGKYCIEHKEDDMINVTGKRCEIETCNCIAQYNLENENQGKYCSQHKKKGMIDIKHRRCEIEGCMLTPSYKFDSDTSCRYCSLHKLEGMTDGKHPVCKFEGCKKFAGYNMIDVKTPAYCTIHKLDGMVDLKHPLCLENGCDKRPIFNYDGKKNGLYCSIHKKDEMVDIISPRCKSTFCETYSYKKYDYYCIRCFIHLFPDKAVIRNYKTKEKSVVDFVISKFEHFTWISDKRIQDGCSKRRPDLFLDMGSHIIIVEIDENQHNNYDCSCENKRLMEISRDIGHRPLIFIRFNPDEYIDIKNNIVTSCWKASNKSGILCVSKTKIKEWNNRLLMLQQQIEYWISNKPDKMVEIVQLYYAGMVPT